MLIDIRNGESGMLTTSSAAKNSWLSARADVLWSQVRINRKKSLFKARKDIPCSAVVALIGVNHPVFPGEYPKNDGVLRVVKAD